MLRCMETKAKQPTLEMKTALQPYVRAKVSNGNEWEQALIRRWWHEQHDAKGRIVWEYHLEGKYADAIWFPEWPGCGIEEPGQKVSTRFPLKDAVVVLCEAKVELDFELIGQALVYAFFAGRAGPKLLKTIIFADSGTDSMEAAAAHQGWEVVLRRHF